MVPNKEKFEKMLDRAKSGYSASMRWLALPLLLLVACGGETQSPNNQWQEILGRDEGSVRRPVYRAQVPDSWKREDPAPGQSISDTRLANVTFRCGELVVYVHSFPQRIPPEAQVARWQRQLGGATRVAREAHGGFAGLRVEGEGLLAWAMQLDGRLYQTLEQLGEEEEERLHFAQMASDYTIKATGPVEEHRTDLERFARSFELIQAVPA